jgi:hypothetical protein
MLEVNCRLHSSTDHSCKMRRPMVRSCAFVPRSKLARRRVRQRANGVEGGWLVWAVVMDPGTPREATFASLLAGEAPRRKLPCGDRSRALSCRRSHRSRRLRVPLGGAIWAGHHRLHPRSADLAELISVAVPEHSRCQDSALVYTENKMLGP